MKVMKLIQEVDLCLAEGLKLTFETQEQWRDLKVCGLIFKKAHNLLSPEVLFMNFTHEKRAIHALNIL
jgi:hypothetical protein